MIRAIFKGISGLSFVLGMALSFAPATQTEQQMFGASVDRQTLILRRMAVGALWLEGTPLFDMAASLAEVPPLHLALALGTIANGGGPQPESAPQIAIRRGPAN